MDFPQPSKVVNLGTKLLDNKTVLFVSDITSPQVEIRYSERKRTWRKKWDGSLEFRVFHQRDGWGTEFDKVYFRELDVTPVKLDSEPTDYRRKCLEDAIFEYASTVAMQIQLAAKKYLTEDELCAIERSIIENVALVTERPGIAGRYDEWKKEIDNRKQQEERARLLQKQTDEERQRKAEQDAIQKAKEERHKQVLEGVRLALIGFESAEMYRICIDASKGIDYELPRGKVEERVRHLFNSDDNLKHRPLFKPTDNGDWADFIKKTLGEGFYNKMKNVEGDLDEFYLTVLEEVQRKCGEEAKPAEEMYYETMRDKFTLDDVLDLLERERNVYTDLLQRFAGILEKSRWNYQEVLDDVKMRLSPTGGAFTSIDPQALIFSVQRSTANDNDEFRNTIDEVKSDLTRYLDRNGSSVRVPQAQKTELCQGQPVIRVVHGHDVEHAMTGSYGEVTYRHCFSYGDSRYNVQFSYVTGRPADLPHKVEKIPEDNLRLAKRIEDVYGGPECAAAQIVEAVVQKALSAKENRQLSSEQETIKKYHPYLEEQIKFRQGFYERMKERFERIYSLQEPTEAVVADNEAEE